MFSCVLPKAVAVIIFGIIIFLLMENGLINKSKLSITSFFNEAYKGRVADFLTASVIAYFIYDLFSSLLVV